MAVTLTERNPADYDPDKFRDGRLPTVPSTTPVVPVIAGVTGWAAVAVNAGGRPGIRLSWNAEINASAVSWTIRLASDGSIVNRGSLSDLSQGSTTITAGLRPNTAYRVTGRLVLPRRTAETQEIIVTTMDIGIEASDLSRDVRDTLSRFDEFVGEVPGLIDERLADVEGEVDAVSTRLTNATAGLSADVAAARQLAMDNLNVARSYTDTSVLSESVARQTETGQLAARIDQITAAPTSNNLLTNGDFADGVTAWSGGVRVVDGRALIDNSLKAIQTFPAAFSPSELFQWRLLYSRPNGGSAEVRVAFLNSSGTQLGSDMVTALPGTNSNDKVASGQHPPPSGTAQVRMTVSRSGATMAVDDVAATRIDQQILARIQSLEVVTATDQQALATFKSETGARFGQNEAAITAESTARANADSALSQRIATTEATARDQAARITTTETTLADAVQSLSQLDQLTEAESGRRDLVRDGTFTQVAKYWPGGSLDTAGRIIARNAASSDTRIQTVPAARYYNLLASDAANTWRETDHQAVTPGEVIEVSFAYARGLSSVVPAVRVAFYGANKGVTGDIYTLRGNDATNWGMASGTVTVPSDAVTAKVSVGVAAAGTSTAGVTNVTALRTGAGYASRASVQNLSTTVADNQRAFSSYQTQVSSRFDSVEAKTQASADALLNVYTKAATNQAIAGQINDFNATLTDRLGQKANASTVTALDSRVKATEAGLTATSDAITATNADVGRFKAGGLFRVQSVASPSGALSRIALSAAASEGDVTRTAGLFLEAIAGGRSRAVIAADLFAVATGNSADATLKTPFIVSGNKVIMGDAMVETLSIAGNAVTVPITGSSSALVTLTGTFQNLVNIGINRQGAPTLAVCTFQVDGANGAALANMRLIRDGTDISGPYPTVSGSRGTQTSGAISILDEDTGTGPTIYRLQGQSLNSGDYTAAPRIVRCTMTILHVKR